MKTIYPPSIFTRIRRWMQKQEAKRHGRYRQGRIVDSDGVTRGSVEEYWFKTKKKKKKP